MRNVYFIYYLLFAYTDVHSDLLSQRLKRKQIISFRSKHSILYKIFGSFSRYIYNLPKKKKKINCVRIIVIRIIGIRKRRLIIIESRIDLDLVS